jgi:hypothetical protein
MAIAKNPKRKPSVDMDREAEAFISGAGQKPQIEEQRRQNKKPMPIRIDPDMLQRIDRAARRLGISRSAFIVSSVAERLERME